VGQNLERLLLPSSLDSHCFNSCLSPTSPETTKKETIGKKATKWFLKWKEMGEFACHG